MRYRLLGRTGLYVSEICLGAMTYGGKGRWEVVGTLGVPEAQAQIQAAFDAGVNFIDTANVYSEGGSESIVGEALAKLGLPREDLVIATKVRVRMGPAPNRVGLTRVHIMNELHASLRRLRLEHVDLYQIHGVDQVTPLDETLRALEDLVRAGKVRYIGLCNLAAWEIAKSIGISERRGWARFESVQAYYSIAGRDLEREIVPLSNDQHLAILPWSPLAGGLLSGKFTRGQAGPEGARRTTFDFPPVDKERMFTIVDAMRPIASRHEVSVARVALAWLLHQPHVTSIIIGVRTREQLLDNLAATDLKLTAEELAALDKVSALTPEYPGWMLERMSADRLAMIQNG